MRHSRNNKPQCFRSALWILQISVQDLRARVSDDNLSFVCTFVAVVTVFQAFLASDSSEITKSKIEIILCFGFHSGLALTRWTSFSAQS